MTGIRLLVLSVLTLASLHVANACTCMFGAGPACEEAWRKSVDAVFLGHIENIEATKGNLPLSAGAMSMTNMGVVLEVTVAVEEGFRGVSGKKVVVYTASSSAACGVNFQKGESYLIYASAMKDAQLTVSLCSATKPAQYATEDISYLRSIRSLKPNEFDTRLGMEVYARSQFQTQVSSVSDGSLSSSGAGLYSHEA